MIRFLRTAAYHVQTVLRPTHARTIARSFSLTFIAVSALAAAALLQDDASYIRIETDAAIVSAEEQFTMSVYVGAHTSVNAVDVAIAFPSERVEVLGIDTGESVISIWTEEPFVEGDKIILRGGTFRRGFLGEHLIARVNMRALESGSANFNVDDITLLAGDGSGSNVQVGDDGVDALSVIVANADGNLSGIVEVQIKTDIDGNGDVSLKDVESFMIAWRSRSQLYDFNGDNKMTFKDFAIILSDSFFK